MEISVRRTSSICEVTIKSANTIVTEDLAMEKGFQVEESVINDAFEFSFTLARHNHQSDVDTMLGLFESKLTSMERKEFIERVQN
jgi:hypothetical protein